MGSVAPSVGVVEEEEDEEEEMGFEGHCVGGVFGVVGVSLRWLQGFVDGLLCLGRRWWVGCGLAGDLIGF